MKLLLQVLIFVSILIGATYLYLKSTTVPIDHDHFLNVTEITQERVYYSFRNGKVKINEEDVGTYTTYFNSLKITFLKTRNGVKEVEGRVKGKTVIELYFPKTTHKLRLSKG